MDPLPGWLFQTITYYKVMEEQQLSQLEELAKKATTGKWFTEKHPDWEGDLTNERGVESLQNEGVELICGYNAEGEYAIMSPRDCQYIAAANPTTTLALIEEIRLLRATTVPVVGEGLGLMGVLTEDEKALLARIGTELARADQYSLHLGLCNIFTRRSASPTLEGREEKWISVDDGLPKPIEAGPYADFFSDNVLLYLNDDTEIVVGYYDFRPDYQCFQSYDKETPFPSPTHWQPLPTPPAAPTEKGGPQ